jgi:hypothetical protein
MEDFDEAGRPKRSPGQKETHGFQEIGFALGIRPDHQIEARRRGVFEGAIITEF